MLVKNQPPKKMDTDEHITYLAEVKSELLQ